MLYARPISSASAGAQGGGNDLAVSSTRWADTVDAAANQRVRAAATREAATGAAMTIGQLLDWVETLAVADTRNSVEVRRKKATIHHWLMSVIGLPDGWRERVAAVPPSAHPIDHALALADAANGKRIRRADDPLPIPQDALL